MPAPSQRNGQFEQGRLVMGMARFPSVPSNAKMAAFNVLSDTFQSTYFAVCDCALDQRLEVFISATG